MTNAVETLRKALKALEYDMTTIGNKNPCEPEWKALDRLARLVEAAKALLVVRAGPTPTDARPYSRAVTELNDALSAVLGEGE